MVLDITSFRAEKGSDVNIVYESEKKRFADAANVDAVIDSDKKWRVADFQEAELRKQLNSLNAKVIKTKMIEMKKNKIDVSSLPQHLPEDIINAPDLTVFTVEKLLELSQPQCVEFKKLVEAAIAKKKAEKIELDTQRQKTLAKIGNLVHESVPIDQDEENNVVVKEFGDHSVNKKYSHRDLIVMIDGVDLQRGTAVSGSRGYYLKGPGVLLENALIQFALHKLYGKGYIPISPPVMMNKEIMQEVAQLSQFDDELYHVSGGGEQYLIATAEQPLCAYHRNEWMTEKDLETPIRYAGISNCFRKEVGSHGRDTAGIFRVHQFQKIEQFVLTSPRDNKSWDEMELMITNAEEFFQSLNIPYRVVNMVSGELNLAAAKKYDLEAWFPGSKAFRELVSCSNCTDYQSRRLKIRFGEQANNKGTTVPEYVHLLNSTLCATTRGICAILENNQTETGIIVPEALKPYLPPGFDEIPFVKPAPIDLEKAEKEKEAAKKAAKKAKK